VSIDSKDLVTGLAQVVRAASKDDARPILTGVLLQAEDGGLRIEATDSYRLAVRTLPGTEVLGERPQVLVPSRALSEVVRLLGDGSEVELTLGDRDVTFGLPDTTITSRLIEGDFPNTRQLLPTEFPNRLKVDRLALLDALRRVRLLARESTPVRIAQHGDSIELSAVTQDVGHAHESLDASYDGDELTVAFNPDYLLDGLDAISGDEVTLETRDALKPAVLRDADTDDFLYLLMPVRVS
jgi:DNA polymerase-3 subunit beta